MSPFFGAGIGTELIRCLMRQGLAALLAAAMRIALTLGKTVHKTKNSPPHAGQSNTAIEPEVLVLG